MDLVEGELIEEIEQLDEGWWSGVGGGGTKQGLFPANYVEIVEQETATPATPPPLYAPPPPPAQTLAEWLAQQPWPICYELPGMNSRQKTPSQRETYQYRHFDRVERRDELAFLSSHRTQVDELLRRTDTVPEIAAEWAMVRRKELGYRSEAELQSHLVRLWEALELGLPPDNDNEYPEAIRNAPWRQRTVLGGYRSEVTGIDFDIAAFLRTAPRAGDPAPSDTVYLLVEVKTERAILAKVGDLDRCIVANTMPQLELPSLTEAEQMLVQCFTQAKVSKCEVVVLMGHNSVYLLQAVESELFVQGPYYRYPAPGQPAFTPLDAMRVLASAYFHRAYVLRTAELCIPPIPSTPAIPSSPLTATLTRLVHALRHVWDEVRLATCPRIRVRYPNGRVVTYDRSEPALTGPAVSSPLFPVIQWLGRHLFRTVTLNVTECLNGGELATAWRGTVGVTSVIIKTDLMFINDWTEREVIKEWDRLTLALPSDARVASALPIPAYYGLFGEVRASIILMSDCGEPIDDFPDMAEHLRNAQREAIAALESTGVEVHDIAGRNTVFDGTRVRIIDFV
ncbi:hypothetical protein OH77DRAFT_1429821 [Trametes cingulata]|nr:hypothetical protein OH77DRAFT_1429821 [Trametes cingulata]